MHLTPAPAHPDYRLICALRLYATVPQEAKEPPADEQVEEWRQTVYGNQDSISTANEKRWRQTLLRLCESIKERVRSRGSLLAGRNSQEVPAWVIYPMACIEELWKEEGRVAQAVSKSVEEGVEF